MDPDLSSVETIRQQLVQALSERFGPEGVCVVARPYNGGMEVLRYVLAANNQAVLEATVPAREIAHWLDQRGIDWPAYVANSHWLNSYLLVRRRVAERTLST
jgi:hypothetical protein